MIVALNVIIQFTMRHGTLLFDWSVDVLTNQKLNDIITNQWDLSRDVARREYLTAEKTVVNIWNLDSNICFDEQFL